MLRDDVPWGQPALSIAQEILLSEDDLSLFSFKTSPRGYIYIRLDKLSDKSNLYDPCFFYIHYDVFAAYSLPVSYCSPSCRYGCPSMDEIEDFSQIYKTRLDEAGEQGEIPDDLALEVL